MPVMTTTPQPSHVWFAFGVDPIAQVVVVLAVNDDKATCDRDARERGNLESVSPDITYIRSFDMMIAGSGRMLGQWLVSCGVPRSELKNIAAMIQAELEAGRPRS